MATTSQDIGLAAQLEQQGDAAPDRDTAKMFYGKARTLLMPAGDMWSMSDRAGYEERMLAFNRLQQKAYDAEGRPRSYEIAAPAQSADAPNESPRPSRVEKIAQALAASRAWFSGSPETPLFKSIEAQLSYILSVLQGSEPDRLRLEDVNVGLIAVREFDQTELYDPLIEAQSIADRLAGMPDSQ